MAKKLKSSKSASAAKSKKNVENFDTVQTKRETLEQTASLLFRSSPNKLQIIIDVDEDNANLDGVSEHLLNFSPGEAGVEHLRTRSNKRKRSDESDKIAAGSKVQEWQARSNGVATEEEREATTDQSPPKRPKPANAAPQSQSQPLDQGTSQNYTRPTQKELRVVLKKLKDYPNQRIDLKVEIDEAEMMLKCANAVYEQTEVELTEMKWFRYIVEEDVLRHQKQEPTLVDGTEKLGKESSKGKAWKEWLAANSIQHRPEAMGWGYWKEKMNSSIKENAPARAESVEV
ncbi:hypothetical protein BT96DRAFT_1011385 [Gymnopus androsaceus JB14]|uniref:Uncharacterized protein n=1 Tax=Gymnopus androsaceus JB14 TaxID=1447944 RepID=A0A6A4IQW9_9AGAR|nr:hypothetical protein BT96DRAFT_1011385 [Gymnopus androsaceus JB14]